MSRYLFALWVWLSVWCEGGHFTLVPNVLKIIYGKQATQLYGLLFSYLGVCSIVMLLLLKSPLDEMYIWFWFLGGCMSIVALLILVTVFKQDKFERKERDTFGEATTDWN